MKRILFFGPITPPRFGEAVAFETAFNNYPEGYKFLINKNVKNSNVLKQIFQYLRSILLIFRILMTEDIDVVYFSISRGKISCLRDLYLIFISSLLKKEIIGHLHGGDFISLTSNNRVLSYVVKYMYKRVNVVIVLFEEIKVQFSQFKNIKTYVVPNFYDPIFDSIKGINATHQKKITFSFFSNLMYSKGLHLVLEAFDSLSNRYEEICLNIAGGFITDQYLTVREMKAFFEKKVGNNDKIKYWGNLTGESKISFLELSDIFILPSIASEGQPISILEAMITGNVIIVSDINYLNCCIDNENGTIIEVASSSSLEIAMEEYLLNLESLRRKQYHNRIAARSRYSLQEHLKSLYSIISNL